MIVRSTKDFGLQIRNARKSAGYTQAKLAAACGCGVRFISELENGKPTIELGKAMRVAQMLSLDVSLQARG